MARTLSVSSRIYAPGTYGPYSLDSFSRDDADAIELTMSVESWPDVPEVARITVTIGNYKTVSFGVPGRPKAKDGSDLSTFTVRLGFVRDILADANGQPGVPVKRQTTAATATVVVNSSLRTALTVRAV